MCINQPFAGFQISIAIFNLIVVMFWDFLVIRSFVFCICVGCNGKVRTIFLFMLKNILLWHKVGLCLVTYTCMYIPTPLVWFHKLGTVVYMCVVSIPTFWQTVQHCDHPAREILHCFCGRGKHHEITNNYTGNMWYSRSDWEPPIDLRTTIYLVSAHVHLNLGYLLFKFLRC